MTRLDGRDNRCSDRPRKSETVTVARMRKIPNFSSSKVPEVCILPPPHWMLRHILQLTGPTSSSTEIKSSSCETKFPPGSPRSLRNPIQSCCQFSKNRFHSRRNHPTWDRALFVGQVRRIEITVIIPVPPVTCPLFNNYFDYSVFGFCRICIITGPPY